VPAFDWPHTLTYLGAKDGESQSYSVRTGEELSDVLGKQVPANEGKVQLVEIHLAPDDAPRALKMQAGLSARANAE
jgi:pyruvate decarboxylase